jgi:hypothetical protein
MILTDILNEAGVEFQHVQELSQNAGNALKIYVPMAQPYGSFAKALLEPQNYPDLRDSSGRPIAPYDVTAHTLPLLLNVQVKPVRGKFNYRKAKVEAPGELPAFPFSENLAIYKSYSPSMDEGWTRWILKQNGRSLPTDNMDAVRKTSPFSTVGDREIRAGNLLDKYRVILIPDQAARALLNGQAAGTMPPEYTGGLGVDGVKALREFVERGGTLVFLNRASDFAIEQLKLPVKDVVADLPRSDFYVPGSILRIELDSSNPIASGMPKESIAWSENSPVFELSQREDSSVPASAVKVIARYPSDKDPLLSGWLLGGDRIKGKAALVEVAMGKGKIILFGFRPQYRAQSLATYPLFFNAINGK